MRILDRYSAKQLIPVWVWCILVFIFVSCLIDLFEHLDEILRYRIPVQTVLQYYVNFIPLVFVRASPLALLLSVAFVVTRLVRYHELLAMKASGLSLLRMAIPFLFIGWLVALLVFFVNERVVPSTAFVYEQLRQEAFRGQSSQDKLENVTTIDRANRLYHARLFDPKLQELRDLTIVEHDANNRPKKTIYTQRAVYTAHGWLLLYGAVTRLGAHGALTHDPEPFVERLMDLPVTPKTFRQPNADPDTLRYGQLRQLISQLRDIGITNLRRYQVELVGKITLPLMNVIVCLIAFVGSTRRFTRGHLKGLGISLVWGMGYYIGVAVAHGIGKEGLLPVWIAVWVPHVAAVGYCVRELRRDV
ncbi:MAG: LptF/LptG family permease [Candidatus Omnitrophica bacterium]|nr:LptF/LptG family permease [Candidatus Omnitrophota bacterium]